MAVHLLQQFIRAALHRQMQVLTHLIALRHGIDQLLGAVLGVACHKADTKIPLYGIHLPQKLSKAAWLCQPLSIGVNVLPKQSNIPAAALHQLFHLARDISRQTAALAPAHEGNDTIRTEIITAIHHRNKSLKRAFVQNRNIFIQGGVRSALHGIAADTAPSLQQHTG